ncbi:MAG TPA: RDD family protein [Steroidobacteraceae bacterium]|nr:RDD family protein [Steroidobacteraceae bacterium]
MNCRVQWRLCRAALLCCFVLGLGFASAHVAGAQESDAADSPSAHDGAAIVSIGHDSNLAKGDSADAVVSVFGSSTAEGDVGDSVVAVLGDAHVSGHVGDSVVTVLGDAYVNSKVDNTVVAVLGSVTLGPQAEVSGEVVDVFGEVQRSPTAIVHNGVQHVFPEVLVASGPLRAWVHHCLLLGRPLALDRQVGWAWGVAIVALALYVLIALVFPEGIKRCVHTLETRPGHCVLAMLLAILITPVLLLLLLITVIGMIVIPILWIGILCAAIFGRATMLAWIGGRCVRLFDSAAVSHVVLHVLVGGVIVLALYLLPVLGLMLFGLIGAVGFGAVIYTLVLAASAARATRAPQPALASAGAAYGSQGAATASPSASERAQSGGVAFGAAATAAAEADVGAGGRAGTEPGAATAAGPQTPNASAQTVPPATATLPRAGFWLRMGALLLDAVLVGFVLTVLHNSFRIELLVLAAYGAVMWKVKETTIGGVICNLKVVRVDGRPIDWGTAVVRAFGCILSLAVVGLGFLWIVFDPERQAWHDKIAGTIVVRLPHGVPLV